MTIDIIYVERLRFQRIAAEREANKSLGWMADRQAAIEGRRTRPTDTEYRFGWITDAAMAAVGVAFALWIWNGVIVPPGQLDGVRRPAASLTLTTTRESGIAQVTAR